MRTSATQGEALRLGEPIASRPRRMWPRWAADTALTYCIQWSPRNQDVAFAIGRIVDIGGGGLRLHGPVPVRAGWQVSVLFLPRGRPSALLDGRVAWVSPIEGGCSFGLDAPVDAVFLESIRTPGPAVE